jgi:Zn-dependent peptidase ImmA (M78 family)
MAADVNKIVKCFMLAKKVNHYYWLHTPDGSPQPRIENIERVVEAMTGLKIEKKEVTTDGSIIRGFTERYEDKALILIREDQPIEWKKYTAVKEYCHLVYDSEEEFEPDPVVTLDQLVMRRGLDLDEALSPAIISERVAEIMALEIIYPLELRGGDAEKLKTGDSKTLGKLVALRHVPAVHIETATRQTYIEGCRNLWGVLPDVTDHDLDFNF